VIVTRVTVVRHFGHGGHEGAASVSIFRSVLAMAGFYHDRYCCGSAMLDRARLPARDGIDDGANCASIVVVHTVLIVEDDADLRQMLRAALAFAAYRVIEASDGLAALQMIDSDPPDLVLLDLGLPVLSGAIVRQEIAAQAHTRNIPIVVITGEPGDHAELDVACVLRKPVLPDRVVAAVRRCMAAGTAGAGT
jgi:CheY-like chemotaxis protein